MLRPERYEKIVQFVNEKGAVTVDEIAGEMNVSRATIRRDLMQLGDDKVILRTHGGAMKYNKSITAEVPIYLRIHMQKAEKEQVAKAAATLIEESATIYIGAGTTGRELASRLDDFHHLTVVTNDIDVAKEVSRTDNTLIVIGGQLKRSSSTLYGYFSDQMMRELKVDIAFMAVDAVDLENGFMDFSIDEVSIKRLAIHNARRCVMMCDASKFERPAFVNVCPFSSVSTVVTNDTTDKATVEALQELGLKVLRANSGKDET